MAALPWACEPRVLSEDEIRVHSLCTANITLPALTRWLPLLDEHERKRALALQRTEDRRDYLCAHILRRLMLAQAFSHPPAAWQFSTQPGGKPIVTAPLPAETSLTHTTGFVAVALCARSAIGIDAEAASIPGELLPLLGPAEDPAWLSPPAAQARWVAKEAFAKATGLGLAIPLAELIIPTPESMLWHKAPTGVAAQGWRLWSFPDSSCPMALVAHDPSRRLVLNQRSGLLG